MTVILGAGILSACGRESPVATKTEAVSPPIAQEELISDAGSNLVRAHCGGCHSLALVTSNRGNRETWLGTIRWMQAKQGLWQFDADTEEKILSYLAKNYAPSKVSRRMPIPQSLMPHSLEDD